MTIGKPRMPGAPRLSEQRRRRGRSRRRRYLCRRRAGRDNDRIVKFAKDGHSSRRGASMARRRVKSTHHGIALDSAGQVTRPTASAIASDILAGRQVCAEWKQFGRPSDVVIDKNDVMYVNDAQSTDKTNPGFGQGIRSAASRMEGHGLHSQTDAAIGAGESGR